MFSIWGKQLVYKFPLNLVSLNLPLPEEKRREERELGEGEVRRFQEFPSVKSINNLSHSAWLTGHSKCAVF
jgi:hypothetical protein